MIDNKRLLLSAAMTLLLCLPVFAQADKHDVRAGNRKFNKGGFQEAEIDYRKAVLKDSTSTTAKYNLASSLYRQSDYEGAAKVYSELEGNDTGADYYYNRGDAALQSKDYKTAVEAFKQALLQNPGDMDAKENYVYAKLMLQDQQDQQNQQNQQDQNKDQQNQQDQQNQNKDQDKNQQQQNPDNQDKSDNQQQPQGSNQNISPQQAQQMLKAIQAKEKDTQEKVNKEKAAVLKSRQKEKNW